ncbi:acetyl-CoA carboxylase biotin carboxyl carrier protein [Anaerobium acetethylicum]|uniref:Biotin carboxyl carrier protein of acetyl-CoA carboxylase n=1 Tax=Anaerobium acetethylicum TaxID=1619234 RepID=A0A1D3TVE7_9FIRM|nr:acetyl-CoA carboxylase biotin carboxyl carrier protein [Anaerobium acetethylicum]SCP98101.1 acetyl-CoA carboxylase biotin carboxyl carrier protein [Anaerobium acetethylicum]
MDLESILKLIDKVSASSLSSFTLEEGNMKISLSTNKGGQIVAAAEGIAAAPVQVLASAPVVQESKAEVSDEGNYVKSPLVGTFYAASSPDVENFVKVGDNVKKGQVLGIVEAMKLMNEIECDFDGQVEAILVENNQMVEYGQKLFKIKTV